MIYNYPGADDKDTYDLENMIADPERRIEHFMESIEPFDGLLLADVGAGGGYHAARYAERASQVFAIEPAPAMLKQLYERVQSRGLANVTVVEAGAEKIPLADNQVDVVHSRFAYFFGPGGGNVPSCEPGILEVMRILRPGGYFFIIDNSHTSGQFAVWLEKYGYTKQDGGASVQARNDAFYAALGFGKANIASSWSAPDRDTLRRVISMEFAPEAVEPIMSEVEGSEFSYHYTVYYRPK